MTGAQPEGLRARKKRAAREAIAATARRLFAERRSITTFGPYSPGQAVTIKRMGIEGIYLGGWGTSAKGSLSEDPGPDLASYPLSQVPEEAAGLVRALLTADRNQQYLRLQMTEEQRAATPATDFRPFIIADADTGHGGDPHVRNLIRRFVEAGVPTVATTVLDDPTREAIEASLGRHGVFRSPDGNGWANVTGNVRIGQVTSIASPVAASQYVDASNAW